MIPALATSHALHQINDLVLLAGFVA